MSRYTLVTSIANRFAGMALSAGLLLLVYWLMAIAGGARSYASAAWVLALPIVKLVYAALIIAFCYHLVAGLRHLVWDTGHGLERAQSHKSAWLVGAVSLLLVLVIAYCVWFAGARAS